jgi:tungstate transport system substrate-binding protein
MLRRRLIAAAALALPWPLAAQRRPARDAPLRLGADSALTACGFVQTLAAAFGRESGLPIRWVAAPTSAMLEALEQGEIDAGLGMAPDAEARLEQQGLVHDRRAIARTGFVLVGPAARGVLPDGVAGNGDAARALALLAAASVPFLGRNDGSGAHWLEQSLWRAAAVAPTAPWWRGLAAGADALDAAHEQQSCVIVDRPAWEAGRRRGLTALVTQDARLTVPVHLMRSFHADHPAAGLFARWVTGPRGRRIVAARTALSPPG